MNESLDLRKRILKMRETNKLTVDKSKFDYTKENINTKYVENNSNKKHLIDEVNNADSKHSKKNEESKKNVTQNTKLSDSIIFKHAPDSHIDIKSRKEVSEKLRANNEVQFRILANKFNEAVEVILELSEKVKRLEQVVYKETEKQEKKNKKSFVNFRILVSIFFISLLIWATTKLQFNISLIKTILNDIISTI